MIRGVVGPVAMFCSVLLCCLVVYIRLSFQSGKAAFAPLFYTPTLHIFLVCLFLERGTACVGWIEMDIGIGGVGIVSHGVRYVMRFMGLRHPVRPHE